MGGIFFKNNGLFFKLKKKKKKKERRHRLFTLHTCQHHTGPLKPTMYGPAVTIEEPAAMSGTAPVTAPAVATTKPAPMHATPAIAPKRPICVESGNGESLQNLNFEKSFWFVRLVNSKV